MRLAGKVAAVTGGGSGIGAAAAALFAREGAAVAIIDRDADAAAAVAAGLPGALVLVGDVGDPADVERHAAAVLGRWGRMDVLLTAAGFSARGNAVTIDPADWDAVLRTNLWGTWHWLRAALPPMQAAGRGSIVTVASQLARAGGRESAAYIAAKGAVISLTRTTALDFAPHGIRVNTLLPGAIDTPLLRRSFGRAPVPEAAEAASRARHPQGRFGRAEEVAEAALYLASDAAGFTTGIELPVDGGWLAG